MPLACCVSWKPAMIDLGPHDLEVVKRVLRDHVPDCEVRVFGSRAKWTAKDYSDLDLALVGESELGSDTLARLREAFEDSSLPMRVDVLDWHGISSTFRSVIERDCIELPTREGVRPWKLATLGACASLVGDKVDPAVCGDMPYVGLEHIGQGTLSLLGTGTAKDVNSTKTAFRAGDILFGKLRPYFRKAVRPDFDGICSTDIWVVRPKAGVDAGYLFYSMASEAFVDFASQGSEGTRMPRAKWDHVALYAVNLPSVSEQRAIAQTLGAFDNKIELNERMAGTLEQAVDALFKSWFVDRQTSEREDWRWWRLGELATQHRDPINPSSNPAMTYEHYSIPAYDAGRQPAVEGASRIRSNKTLIPKGSVMVSKLNPSTPRVWVPDSRGVMTKIASTEFLVFVPKIGFGRGLLWAAFRSVRFQQALQGLATGTSKSHQRDSRSDVLRLECAPGKPTVFAAFESAVAPLVEEHAQVTANLRSLRDLRDTLLPKLLSGQIRVQEADEFAEAAT